MANKNIFNTGVGYKECLETPELQTKGLLASLRSVNKLEYLLQESNNALGLGKILYFKI